ncbi:ImmA/IrrE family metallo-endopeptidase [Streptomyces sp. NBC_01565]|uniref:ImmA/IrrE family metallo-endopeptidase n=1 Tax=Streptomyces sp. NBC_01565 TaxID=2975881 RepID=UPI002250E285|nr:ImmA/IrrE family metallo-endopeptidase [Streptomyces sp. NBC_01565]MCX4541306.1 ImmA/IrrE family metallo-endopeptidase [Streptomyces sp. NBC_01565]
MAGKLAPINTDVLDWAVRESGLSSRELAASSKIPEERLHSILVDHDQPMTGEFRALAKALARPTAFFFLPRPPVAETAKTSFRYPPGRGAEDALHFAERSALRSALRWQKIASWVRKQNEMDPAHLPRLPEEMHPEVVAEHLGNWLRWDISYQKKAASASAVFKMLRERVEDHGVVVMQFSLGSDSCRGFSLPHADSPVIAVNSAYNVQARIFTLLHEITHLLRGDSALCGDPRDDSVERFCESSAAIFLVPAEDLHAYVIKRLKVSRVDDMDHVRKVANHYKISMRAAAIRLRQIGRADALLYEKVNRIAEFGGGGFNPNVERQTTPVIRHRELGAEIPRLLFAARDSGSLSETEVRRHLDVDGKQLAELRERVSRPQVEA